MSTILANYPNLAQRSAKINGQLDCVVTSLIDGLEFLTGKQFDIDTVMTAVYGAGYVGFASADHFVAFCASHGVRLFAIDGNGTQLVADVHQQIQQQHPTLGTEPDVYALAHPTWSHVISFFEEAPDTLTARDPWSTVNVTHTDAQWAQLFEYNQVWAMELIVTLGTPTGWTDDGATLTAPNHVQIQHGFRTWVLAHNWNPDNWPLEPEREVSPLEASNPGLGNGAQIIFRWTMLGYTAERGVFEEWVGQELMAVRASYAKIYAWSQTVKQTLAVGQAQPPTTITA